MAVLAALLTLCLPVKSDGWVTTTLSGGYSIEAPKKLEALVLTGDAAKAGNIYVGADGNTTFVAVVTPIPATVPQVSPDVALADFYAAYLNDVGGVPTSQRDLLYRGWLGLEANAKLRNGASGRYRAFATGSKVVEVSCAWQGAAVPAAVDRFMLSLAIPVNRGNGPVKKAGPEFVPFRWSGSDVTLSFPVVPKAAEEKIATSGMKRTTLTARYGSRFYVAMYTDLPNDAADHIVGQEKELRAFVAEQAVDGMPITNRKETEYKVDGVDVFSLIADSKKGVSMRVDTFIIDFRVYGVLVVAPQPLINGDDVKDFYKAMKIKPLL